MELAELAAHVAELERHLERAVAERVALSEIQPTFHTSAQNLVHYLALRQHDLRALQEQLSRLGLSSLGRAEARVQPTLQAVRRALAALSGNPSETAAAEISGSDDVWENGPALLEEHTLALLGPPPEHRGARIMVTIPGAAAGEPALLRDLMLRGMDCARINCAHDDPSVWMRIMEHVRQAERALGRRCRISMDLAGPKLRTGPLDPQPGVLKVRPQRDDYGRVLAPARLLLHEPGPTPDIGLNVQGVPVVGGAWRKLQVGDSLTFVDSRRAPRRVRVLSLLPSGCLVAANRTCYLVAGTEIRLPERLAAEPALRVAALKPRASALKLVPGSRLWLTADLSPAEAPLAKTDPAEPLRIGCTLPQVFPALQAGQRVLFDDGRIEGEVRVVADGEALLEITRTRPGGGKLRSDKGINLPDSRLEIDPLTPKDLADLPLICAHADMVALSFANEPRDVRLLVEAIEREGSRRPAVIVKVETRRAFENLPGLLLEAMRTPACGVMIARGDLAVECGFERLAELQEEILWICEAAHVPVIWATQVLESLAKEGLPSRAEITDAAMGDRAECVMLNKGPHILRAVATLDNILERMHRHQSKKRAMLRSLHLAQHFFDPAHLVPHSQR